MLVANQTDFKIPKKISNCKSCKFAKNTKILSDTKSVVIEKKMIPTNGTLLSIRQMKEGKVMPFSVLEKE